MTRELAIFGGAKTINYSFRKHNPIGKEEIDVAKEVLESGVLSQFVGENVPEFYGGPRVQRFERMCEEYFDVTHAITVNSWTSGLIAAVGAIGIEPGDEIIVSPWTMSASATAILHWNAIPVFADIEPKTFCIDPISVEKNISSNTKAIIAVDIFGHPADMNSLMRIADKYSLRIISDSAQAPGARYHGLYSATIADIGGYSLNYHKHIHTGEGGILLTNNSDMADRLRLIRNHAEAVVEDNNETDLSNMIGYNFRLGEIESAIGMTQLQKLAKIVEKKQSVASLLTSGLQGLRGIQTPTIEPNCTHSFYTYPMVLDVDELGVSRKQIIDCLTNEGVHGLSAGYVNLHLLPMYQNKLAYGGNGFPWTSEICKREVVYDKGICPIAEVLHDSSFMNFSIGLLDLDEKDADLIVKAFQKVWANLSEVSSCHS